MSKEYNLHSFKQAMIMWGLIDFSHQIMVAHFECKLYALFKREQLCLY